MNIELEFKKFLNHNLVLGAWLENFRENHDELNIGDEWIVLSLLDPHQWVDLGAGEDKDFWRDIDYHWCWEATALGAWEYTNQYLNDLIT